MSPQNIMIGGDTTYELGILRSAYVDGRIEVDEFEREVVRLLKRCPKCGHPSGLIRCPRCHGA